MNGNETHEIAGNEYRFRFYVVKTLGGMEADIGTVKEQNAEQYKRISRLERDGCARGVANAERIAELKASPVRANVTMTAAIGSVLAACAVAITRWIEWRAGK